MLKPTEEVAPHSDTSVLNCRVITRQFDDIDAFAQGIKPLILTADQLTPGGFQGTLNIAQFSGLQFTYVRQNQTLQAKGEKSQEDFSFGIAFSTDSTPVLAHGRLIKKSDLFGFDPTREVDMIVGKDAGIAIANVNQQVFRSLAAQMGYEGLDQGLLKQNFAHAHHANFRQLRAYYEQFIEIMRTNPSLLMRSQMSSLMVEDFVPLLINTMGAIAGKKQVKSKTLCCYSLIKKAQEIVSSYPDRPLTLKQLCDELGTSSSNISSRFQDVFGLSPMAYLKIQRLNGVRRALKNHDPQTTTVTELAEHWGFWSMGHFSRDYKKMFGESPSETAVN